MKKKFLLFATMLAMLVCLLALSVSAARVENYEDTYTLANDTKIIHYYTWTYLDADGVTEKTVNRGYTDNITVEFVDEEGNPLTEVALWEYDEEDGRYYSLVWYISDWDYVTVDTEIQDSTAGTQIRPVFQSAVYTLTKVRAVELKFYNRDWKGNLLDQASWVTEFTINGTEWAHSGESLKVLQGIYLDVNNTPDDKTDDLKLNHAAGFSRYSDGANHGDYEGQFAYQGNKIVVANLRDCDFQRDAYENYGASCTWTGATHLQYLAYPDTMLYMNGGIGSAREIDFGEGLEIIHCHLLQGNKTVETIVLPNSLLYLDSEAFRESTCKTLVIGEGLLYAPSNVYQWKSCNFEKMYVSKNILTTYQGYLTKHENNGSPLLAYSTDIFFDGNLEQATELMERMISENSSYDGKITLLDYNDVQTRGELKNTVIFYNYNRCDAFYKGVHNYPVNEDNECCATCERCNKFISFESPVHKNVWVLEGTYLVGYKATSSCKYCETLDREEDIEALFVSKGYSCTELDGTISIVQGFDINRDAVSKYEEYSGKTLSYGVVATSVNKVADGKPGTEMADGIIATDFTTRSANGFTRFEIKVSEIEEGNQGIGLYACAYVIEDEKVYYISDGECGETVVAKTALEIKG